MPSTVATGPASARDGSGLTRLTPKWSRRSLRGLASVWSLGCASNQLKRDTRTLAGQSRRETRTDRAGIQPIGTVDFPSPEPADTASTGTRRVSPCGICTGTATSMRTVSSSAPPGNAPQTASSPVPVAIRTGSPGGSVPDRTASAYGGGSGRRPRPRVSPRIEASPRRRRAFAERARSRAGPASERAEHGRQIRRT